MCPSSPTWSQGGSIPYLRRAMATQSQVVIVRRCPEICMVTPNSKEPRSWLLAGIRLSHYHVTVKSATRVRVPPSFQPEECFPYGFQWGELGTRSSKRDESEPQTPSAPDDLTSRHEHLERLVGTARAGRPY